MPRGRKRTVKPYLDLVEEHPWKRFPIESSGAKHFILGSFPPNKFTHRADKQKSQDVRFFYGSKDNVFWDLFSVAKHLPFKWRNSEQALKEWLVTNQWIVSDIVSRTHRRDDTAVDTDLIVNEWNTRVIDQILSENPIETIFFTSRWVEEKFNSIVRPQLQHYNSVVQQITLISPSRNGLRRIEWSFERLPRNLGETLSNFRSRYYVNFLKD